MTAKDTTLLTDRNLG